MRTDDIKDMLKDALDDLKGINMDYLREGRLLAGSPHPPGHDVRRAEEERHRTDAYMGSDTLE
ncbi:hypothetical protein [Geoalkalibacter sp.]|uniref:hypothetical protein n=1 Tax=Geoalkalibacter sp. TaxID=3041440 RepID=UPI00272E46E5|nr:hypothetical protein [Geoalkalibacter sp.]